MTMKKKNHTGANIFIWEEMHLEYVPRKMICYCPILWAAHYHSQVLICFPQPWPAKLTNTHISNKSV